MDMKKSIFFNPLAFLFFGIALLCVLPMPSASGQEEAPYFSSLRFDRTYVRSGPGRNYPVIRVYSKKRIPLEVTAFFDDWRRIRDWDGEEGWILRTQLARQRSVIVVLDTVTLYEKPDTSARKKARLAKNRLAIIKKCIDEWCKIETDGYNGWLRKSGLWGFYHNELIN
jgi:SH3-like domain-containing protein